MMYRLEVYDRTVTKIGQIAIEELALDSIKKDLHIFRLNRRISEEEFVKINTFLHEIKVGGCCLLLGPEVEYMNLVEVDEPEGRRGNA